MTGKKEEKEHSPLPWRVAEGTNAFGGKSIYAANGVLVGAWTGVFREEKMGDPDFIVEAVNSNERLVEENEELRREIGEANEYADLLKAAKDGLSKENARLRDLVRRSLGFLIEWSIELENQYMALKGREMLPRAQGIIADIDECGDVIKEARAALGEEAGND